MKLATAQSKIRSARGSSFLVNGGDDYDHRSLNKARRQLDRAMIDESLEDQPLVESKPFKWVVEAFRQDGDKYWLDDYVVILVTDDFHEANNLCAVEDERPNETTLGRPAPKSRLLWTDDYYDGDEPRWDWR